VLGVVLARHLGEARLDLRPLGGHEREDGGISRRLARGGLGLGRGAGGIAHRFDGGEICEVRVAPGG